MPIPHPDLDDSRFQELADEALTRIPAHHPDWTDHIQSDPGVTLVQLFVWVADLRLYRLQCLSQSSRVSLQKIVTHLRVCRSRSRMLITGGNKKARLAAARFISSRLDLNLYRIDLSRVVSKYIGETEKNLRHLFALAGGRGAVLFFDEADALFGKRSEVKDSHDLYANQDIDWLLQRLARYEGLIMLATNSRENLDAKLVCKLQRGVSMPARKPKQPAKAARKRTK